MSLSDHHAHTVCLHCWWHLPGLVPLPLTRLHVTAVHALQKTYIFAMVPHGVTAISGWMNFGTEATDFSKHFPGEYRPCTAGASG